MNGVRSGAWIADQKLSSVLTERLTATYQVEAAKGQNQI
jgi:hypothetical protein